MSSTFCVVQTCRLDGPVSRKSIRVLFELHFPTRVIYRAHFISLVIPVIYYEKYKLRSSYLYNFLHPATKYFHIFKYVAL
jgi:hypothetical protein